ncbi:hypothetical protein [Flavihumibacter sp. UBA7668]|uniref:hypothetical protein n=1 Tax=Flavihumibacter sp. UBA7668 TaxID=1946542 RepID=UPI0025B8619F|nr:hypothetical protein [Flavihumibacter sp. UBA7668]
MLGIDPTNYQIRIDGKKSRWKGPSPAELGFSKKYGIDLGDAISPTISKRKFKRETS